MTGKYRLSMEQLSKRVSCSTTTVHKAIHNLHEFRYIDKIRNFLFDGSHGRVVWDKYSYVTRLETNHDFTFIPYSIFDYSLTFSAFVLYCYLRYKAGNAQKAFPSYALIYQELGLCKSAAQRGAKQLENAGLLHIEHFQKDKGDFANNSYHFTESTRPSSKSEGLQTVKVCPTVPPTSEVRLQCAPVHTKKVIRIKRTCIDTFVEFQRAGHLLQEQIQFDIDMHQKRNLGQVTSRNLCIDCSRLLL